MITRKNSLTDEEFVYWILWKSELPYFEIILPDCPYQVMLNEALAVKDLFVYHRDKDELHEKEISNNRDYGHKGWKSVCIHGESLHRTENYNEYDDNKGKHESEVDYKWIPEIIERCPETVRYFKEYFPQTDYQRLRFMWLDPKGYIQPHNDIPFSILGPINISLNNPIGCEFKMEDVGIVPFKDEGSAFLMNLSHIHSVTNNSDIPRIHIISHGKPNKNFNKVVLDSYKTYLKKIEDSQNS